MPYRSATWILEPDIAEMKHLSVEEIRRLLPEVEALRPLLDEVAAAARPDAERRWAGSGELGTVGERLVDPEEVDELIPGVLERMREHLATLYDSAARAIHALADDDPRAALDALLAGAEAEWAMGHLRQAEAFIEAALGQATRLPDRRVALPALITGARIARAAGRWETAEARYLKVLALARDAEDAQHAATAAVGAGNVAVDRGLWELARMRYDEAEPWVRRLGPEAPEGWHLELNRSIVAREEGRLLEAGEHWERAKERAEEASTGEEVEGEVRAILSNARGQILQARGLDQDAEVAFRHALEAARRPDAQVTIGVNLAEVLLEKGRTLEAGQMARDAEELALTAHVTPRLPEVYRVLGRVAAARGHADAFVFFERALEVIREQGLPDFERARTLEVYGRYDQQRGEPDTGRARLQEAARILGRLGCRTALDRVQALMNE